MGGACRVTKTGVERGLAGGVDASEKGMDSSDLTSDLTEQQRRLIEEALALVSAVQEDAGAKQTLETYLRLGEATRKLETILGLRRER